MVWAFPPPPPPSPRDYTPPPPFYGARSLPPPQLHVPVMGLASPGPAPTVFRVLTPGYY